MLLLYGTASKTACSIKLNNMNTYLKKVLFAGLVAVSVLPVQYVEANHRSTQGNITVVATKIVCNAESLLPNWGAGGHTIIENTATNFLADKGSNCWLEDGWSFQWAPNDTPNPGNNIGVAGSPWTTFGPTGSDGKVSTQIDLNESGDEFWIREVLQDGYLGFSGVTTTANVSAEMYCNVDVYHFDNMDLMSDVLDGGTYYCVAFNFSTAQVPEPTPDPTPVTSQSASSVSTDSGGGSGGSSRPGQSNYKSIGGSAILGESCGLYMGRFIRLGQDNDIEQVAKLQAFLNKWMDAGLPITGIYDTLTMQAVNAFQLKYADEILAPWGLTRPTGIVYQTTLRQINSLECPYLSLEIPTLVAWSGYLNTPSALVDIQLDEDTREVDESREESQTATVIQSNEANGKVEKFFNFLKKFFRR